MRLIDKGLDQTAYPASAKEVGKNECRTRVVIFRGVRHSGNFQFTGDFPTLTLSLWTDSSGKAHTHKSLEEPITVATAGILALRRRSRIHCCCSIQYRGNAKTGIIDNMGVNDMPGGSPYYLLGDGPGPLTQTHWPPV